ncbi:MAG: hypothetical protein KatS3mg054_0031 [Chloroflexus sp.]|nr:MAG: hypothetical protein KatS3mg054_0031 [Chloroflexus sp.]
MDDFGVTMEGSTVRIYDCVAWVQSKSQDVRPLRLQLSNCVAFVNIEQYPLLLNIYATNSIVVINPPVMVYRYPILLESCALSSIVIGRPYAPAFLPQSLVISERFYRRMRFNLLPKPHKIRQALQDVRGIDGSRMRGVLAPPVMGTARQAGVDIYFVNMLYPSVTLRDKYSSGPGEGYSLEVFNVTDMPFANTTTQLNVPDKQHDRYRLHHVPTTYTPGIISLLT